MAQGHEGFSNTTTTVVKIILLLFDKHTKAADTNFHYRVAQRSSKSTKWLNELQQSF